MKRPRQERIVVWPGAFCCLIVLGEQSGSSLKVKRKENKTHWRLPDIVCPLNANAACIGLASEAFGPKAVYSATNSHFRNKGDSWTQKTERRKKKEGGRLVSGCKSSHMCLAAAAACRGSTGGRPKAAALIKFPWSLVNLRVGEDDRERLALLDACRVSVEQLTRTLTTSEATANANRFLFYFYQILMDHSQKMYREKNNYFETVTLELLREMYCY